MILRTAAPGRALGLWSEPPSDSGHLKRGELRADASPSVLATALLASIEGGMVLSQTRKDPASLHIAVEAGLGQVRAQLN